jgi:hypothetical protein
VCSHEVVHRFVWPPRSVHGWGGDVMGVAAARQACYQ